MTTHEPPNFREAECRCCQCCKHRYYDNLLEGLHCIKYGTYAPDCYVCDDYEEEKHETK